MMTCLPGPRIVRVRVEVLLSRHTSSKLIHEYSVSFLIPMDAYRCQSRSPLERVPVYWRPESGDLTFCNSFRSVLL